MVDIDDRLLVMRQAYLSQNNLLYRPAILGDAEGNYIDPNSPGYVIIREQTSNGLSQPRRAFLPANLNIALKPGAPIKLGRDEFSREIVLAVDSNGTLAGGTNTIATVQVQQTDSTPQSAIETLVAIPTSNLTVSVKGWNPIVNGTYYAFGGASIDLATANGGGSFVPSAGEMRYAVIFVKSDYTTLEATGSTPVDAADIELGAANIQECLDAASPGSTPVCAIQLSGGQTTIAASDITNNGDLRQMVNTGAYYKYTPSGTADTAGHLYDMAYDDSYLYLKTAAGWKRSALSTF